jgi:SsrA-binding protein
MSEGQPKAHVKIIAKNRRAHFDYHVESRVEAGIALTGTEVKSLREGSAQLSDSYAIGQRGELFLLNAQIPPYKPAGPLLNHEPKRTRKLLLHRREIDKLITKASEKGLTLVPLQIYFKNGVAKVEICVARGRKLYDKREALKKQDARRDMDRALRGRG